MKRSSFPFFPQFKAKIAVGPAAIWQNFRQRGTERDMVNGLISSRLLIIVQLKRRDTGAIPQLTGYKLCS